MKVIALTSCTYCDRPSIRETKERTHNRAGTPVIRKINYCRVHLRTIAHKGLDFTSNLEDMAEKDEKDTT